MDGSIGQQIGIYGIFALMLIKALTEMLKAVKTKGNGGSHEQIAKDTKQVAVDTNDKVKALHTMHEKTDGDGVPLCYTPRSIVNTQKEIAKTQADTVNVIKDVSRNLKDVSDTLKIVNEKVTH